jgi:hypothetical protein
MVIANCFFCFDMTLMQIIRCLPTNQSKNVKLFNLKITN